MQQLGCLRHVVDVGRRADDAVHQARFGVHADVRVHAEVPLVALLRLMHLGVALAVLAAGRQHLQAGGAASSATPCVR
jgi:hypothetical protein